MSADTASVLRAKLAGEITTVVGALIEDTPSSTIGLPHNGAQWELTVVGADNTAVGQIGVDEEDAAELTRHIMGLNGPVPSEAVIDTLREICSQSLSALSLTQAGAGQSYRVGNVTRRPAPGSGDDGFGVAVTKLPRPIAISIGGAFVAAAGPRPVAAPARGVEPSDRIDVILDIDLPLIVRFGRTEMTMRNLMRVGPGSLIDLGRSPDEPVEILVSNRVVAHGEVVIVGGNYGVRILDVVSARDRIALGA